MIDEFQRFAANSWQGGTLLRIVILMLTSLLVGMGLGGFLPPEMAKLYALIGGYGLLAYLALTLAAHYRARRGQSLRQAANEQRVEQLRAAATRLLNRRT